MSCAVSGTLKTPTGLLWFDHRLNLKCLPHTRVCLSVWKALHCLLPNTGSCHNWKKHQNRTEMKQYQAWEDTVCVGGNSSCRLSAGDTHSSPAQMIKCQRMHCRSGDYPVISVTAEQEMWWMDEALQTNKSRVTVCNAQQSKMARTGTAGRASWRRRGIKEVELAITAWLQEINKDTICTIFLLCLHCYNGFLEIGYPWERVTETITSFWGIKRQDSLSTRAVLGLTRPTQDQSSSCVCPHESKWGGEVFYREMHQSLNAVTEKKQTPPQH